MNFDAQFNLDRHECIRECQTAYAYLAKRPYSVLAKHALFGVMGHLTEEIKRQRKRIAEDCEPWFDGSAFTVGLSKEEKCGCPVRCDSTGCNPLNCLGTSTPGCQKAVRLDLGKAD